MSGEELKARTPPHVGGVGKKGSNSIGTSNMCLIRAAAGGANAPGALPFRATWRDAELVAHGAVRGDLAEAMSTELRAVIVPTCSAQGSVSKSVCLLAPPLSSLGIARSKRASWADPC